MIWIVIIVVVLAAFYWRTKKINAYWIERGVPQGNPTYLLGDTVNAIFRKQSAPDMFKGFYDMFAGRRYGGIYQMTMPTFLVRDPELIKQITIKDFDHFTDHRGFAPGQSGELWSKNLFALKGKAWRDMRSAVSPSFTSSKMRHIFVLMVEVSENFLKYFEKQTEDVIEFEAKDTFTRFTNDVIASTAFGINVDSLTNRDNEFYRMGLNATNFNSTKRFIKFVGYFLFPKLYEFFSITFLDKEIDDFFLKVIKENIKTREENNIVRPDLIHILLEARKGKKDDDHQSNVTETGFAAAENHYDTKSRSNMDLTDFDIAAQALVFFFAGFESVATAMSFTAYELAGNPEVQEKLREEINRTIKETNGKLTYEALVKMKYLDMVVSETLRKWPAAFAMERVCTKPYTIEPVLPDEVPVTLEEGTYVTIPTYGIHHDPTLYPNPEQFDPERFNDENKKNINPLNYLTFGIGPRNCIGSRFALLEVKVIFYHILSQYEIVQIPKMKFPLQLSKRSVTLAVEGGTWLGFKRIKKNM